MRLGVLGGTFDPVHNGHIAVAEEVRERLYLDEVLFVPAYHSPMKGDDDVLAAEWRVEMVRLAIENYPHLTLSSIEIDRGELSYTGDTIAGLRKAMDEGDELYFIIGLDNLAQFPYWKEPDRIIKTCKLVAVPRPGYALPDLEAIEKDLPGLSDVLTALDGPEVDISATEIRHRVALGQPIDHLVPEPVARYIFENKLYAV